jgi:hypothetical protein
MALRSKHGYLKTDITDFREREWRMDGDEGKSPLCRGKRLYRLIEELSTGGWKADPDLGVAGGFSDSPNVCKQFGARGNEGHDGPPAVYYGNRANYIKQHPTLQPIQYNEEWLAAHPNVTGVCQTFPGKERRRSINEEVSSAMCYKGEHEWVAEEDLRPLNLHYSDNYYLKGRVNIYLDDTELRRMGINVYSGYNSLGHLCPELKEAITILENLIPADLEGVDKYGGIGVYYCDSHSDLMNANSSGGYCSASDTGTCKYDDPLENTACVLVEHIQPKGKPFKEGFEYPRSYPT